MYLEETGCCAVQEIVHLKEHKTSEDAMKAFCEVTLLYRDYDWNPGVYNTSYFSRAKLHGHYTFTGVVGYKTTKVKPKYAPNFAAFIKKHQLGAVVAGKPGFNRTNHPTHLVQIYVWTPNQVKVKGLV